MKAEKEIEELKKFVQQMSVVKDQMIDVVTQIEKQQIETETHIKEIQNKHPGSSGTTKNVVQTVIDTLDSLEGKYKEVKKQITNHNYAEVKEGENKECVQIIQLLNAHRRALDWMERSTNELKDNIDDIAQDIIQ
ncbi:mucin-2 precursor, putative [Entamoeba histolytica HM-1:IMSS-B]|nr:mucin-2 precursor, putative [Entamoeba histolytica HM-1:IMSS-B]ENY65069.1 mucin-2 precursor, putative [Entamoeba histolytica HM-1:IMSS-A]